MSTIRRLLRNKASVGTVYYNRREAIEGNGPGGARTRKTRYRERPREEWIPIQVPAIVDRDTFECAQRVSRDNSKWNPRGAEPGAWPLRGLVECCHCGVGVNSTLRDYPRAQGPRPSPSSPTVHSTRAGVGCCAATTALRSRRCSRGHVA